MKDKRIRLRPAEREVVVRHGVRCFCSARGNLTGAQLAAAFVAARERIERACAEPGPFVYQVSVSGGVRRVL